MHRHHTSLSRVLGSPLLQHPMLQCNTIGQHTQSPRCLLKFSVIVAQMGWREAINTYHSTLDLFNTKTICMAAPIWCINNATSQYCALAWQFLTMLHTVQSCNFFLALGLWLLTMQDILQQFIALCTGSLLAALSAHWPASPQFVTIL